LARVNLFLNEFIDLNDVSLLLKNLIAEGKSILSSKLAMCFLLDEEDNLAYQVGPESLIRQMTALIAEQEKREQHIPGSHYLFEMEALLSSQSLAAEGIESCQAILVFPLRAVYSHAGYLVFLLQSSELDQTAVGEGELIAHLAGLALQNSFLTDTVLSQSAEMGLFYETTAALSFQMDSTNLLNTTLEKALKLLEAGSGYIFISECDAGPLQLQSTTVASDELVQTSNSIPESLATHVSQLQQPVLWHPQEIRELFTNGHTSHVPEGIEQLSALTAPMDWGQERIGVMVFLAHAPARTFTDRDLSQMRLIALHSANALGVANLMEAEREQRRIAEALQSASVMIARQIHLEEVLDKILEQAMHAFHCDASNVMVVEGSKARIARARGYEDLGLKTDTIENYEMSIPEHFNLSRLSEGEALYVPDISKDENWVIHPGFNWCQSWAGVPIVYSGTLLGFLNLDSSSLDAFSADVLHQLQAFATHAAIALHKARLYERLSKEHNRLQQIYDVGRKIGTSFEPEEILNQLLTACFEVLGGVYGTIFGIDPKSGHMDRQLKKAAEGVGNLHELYLVELLAKRIAHIQEPDCDYIAYADRSYWLLGFPLRAGESIPGIVMIWVPSESEFEQAWLDALATLGQQAALSLVKAEKHLELQRRLQELTILQHVSGAIARQLEFDAVLKELTDQLHYRLGYHTTQVFIREQDTLVLRQFSGPDPKTPSLHISQGVVGRSARTGKPELVTDVSLDPHYINAIRDTISELAVPIMHNEEVIGVINVETSRPDGLDEGTRELLLLLADQVSIALQNAKLYKQIRDTVESLESRVKARTAVLEAVALQAQEAEKAKAQFVADVSHELRTPLTNIGLYLDLLEFGPGERYQEYFQTMRRETERLKDLIEQLLAISRLDSDQVELQMQEVHVNALLETLVNDRIMMANKKGLDLIFEMGEALPAVLADSQYLTQVMTNILTNAMNYTPTGGKITVVSSAMDHEGRAGTAFSISDTGPGIPETEQPEIFNRFYRGSTGRSSGVSGTGLGLSISRDIVKQHHGTIMLESKPGKGTTFTIWLPTIETRRDE